MELNPDTFNRLSLGIMQKDFCTPEMAIDKLESLRLNLIGGELLRDSFTLQSALLTAVNTGKRSFLGGIFVQIPAGIISLAHWPGKRYLHEIIEELGGELTDFPDDRYFCLTFGLPGRIDDNKMSVICNSWQGGVLVDGEESPFESRGDLPTAGVFAAGLAVFLAFLKVTGIYLAACDRSQGISLWRPDLNWLDPEASGPAVSYLPNKFWLLGLGHLGQAYLWNIGLLRFKDKVSVSVLLQDDDRIVEANWSAGLLSEMKDAGKYKTRICSQWLEERGFKTTITERRFDGNTRRINEEPFIALCGFDSAPSRIYLEKAGFDLIVEAGLGNDLSTFDLISFHSFPDASMTPEEIWGSEEKKQQERSSIVFDLLKDRNEKDCGILAFDISGKSVSASFIGACTGALVIAELVRGLNGGKHYEKIVLQLRDLENKGTTLNFKDTYTAEHGRNGFVENEQLA